MKDIKLLLKLSVDLFREIIHCCSFLSLQVSSKFDKIHNFFQFRQLLDFTDNSSGFPSKQKCKESLLELRYIKLFRSCFMADIVSFNHLKFAHMVILDIF